MRKKKEIFTTAIVGE